MGYRHLKLKNPSFALMVRNRHQVILLHSLLSFFLLWEVGCHPSGKTEIPETHGIQRADNPENKQMIDSGIALLKTGDLVLRTGADMTSYMLRQINRKDKNYSHCGIAVIENGKPYIYHCIGGEDNPDERLRKDDATIWCSPVYNLGFAVARFDMDSMQKLRLIHQVNQYYKEQRKFDMDFDLATDDRLYCAEMVYKAVNRTMNDSNYIQPVRIMRYSFVAIDNLFLNKHVRFICKLNFK